MPDAVLRSVGWQGELLCPVPALVADSDYGVELAGHPAAKGLSLAHELAEAQVQQAKRQRWPNVKVGVALGSDPSEEDGGRVETFGLGLGIPLPVFDRNLGALGEAVAHRIRAGHEARAGLDQLVTRLRRALQSCAAAREQAASYSTRILPGARQALELVTKAYQSGAVSQLEVLDAQQTLAEAELDCVQTLGKPGMPCRRLRG
ncbi:MAG: TolC family protein [Planctomycetes bacterium]|nr:TolC family protein [Planctomycetota bacterium]